MCVCVHACVCPEVCVCGVCVCVCVLQYMCIYIYIYMCVYLSMFKWVRKRQIFVVDKMKTLVIFSWPCFHHHHPVSSCITLWMMPNTNKLVLNEIHQDCACFKLSVLTHHLCIIKDKEVGVFDYLNHWLCIIDLLLFYINRLVGLMVKVSASRAEDPGFKSCLHRDFFLGRVIPVT